jgi:hypothetical protein
MNRPTKIPREDTKVNKESREGVMSYIEETGAVTFPQLGREFPWLVGGDFAIHREPDKNLIYWTEFSDEGSDFLTSKEFDKRIAIVPCVQMVYILSEGCLKFPVAVRPPKAGYKKKHWLPACLWGINDERIRDLLLAGSR